MASTTKSKVFDSEEASALVKDLRLTFDCGQTRSYEWRTSQLKALLKLTEEHEQEIVQALHSDLSKSETEAFVQEIRFYVTFCSLNLYLSEISER
ncbi:Aldehyde dehydrogenase, partial [Mucuna pruriens]